MLMLPLKTSTRYNIKDDLSKWLDNQSHRNIVDDNNYNSNRNSHYTNARNDHRSTTTTTTTAPPPPSFDTVLPRQLNLTSQQCYKELQRLQSVRNCIIDSILKPNSHAVAIKDNALRDCYEYHAILLEFEQRGFPVVATSSTDIWNDSSATQIQPPPSTIVTIVWKGAYNTTETETHSTLIWDRVCIMYNIAALLSYQIHHDYSLQKISVSTTDRDMYKSAIRDCQLCASILSILRELCSTISNTDQPFYTIDLSSSLLLFWEKYFIAEAQSYIYRMASMNATTALFDNNYDKDDKATIGRQHRTYAVLSQSMYELYNDALNASKDPRLVSEIYDHVQGYGYYTKSLSILSLGRANYHQSIVYHMNGEYGNEIASLRDCQLQLQQCVDFINQGSSSSNSKSSTKAKKKMKDTPASSAASTIAATIDTSFILRECQSLLLLVQDQLRTADAMNVRLYHDIIPKTLPTIPAQQLAKINPILPNDMIVPQIPLFIDL